MAPAAKSANPRVSPKDPQGRGEETPLPSFNMCAILKFPLTCVLQQPTTTKEMLPVFSSHLPSSKWLKSS